jgi:hypothetical protein
MDSVENPYGSYIREKLRGARAVITDEDRPIHERLWSAYVYNLSSLQAQWFPHAEAQIEFVEIEKSLSKYGEAIDGAGSVPTTLWTMSDDDANALAARILALADRYLA